MNTLYNKHGHLPFFFIMKYGCYIFLLSFLAACNNSGKAPDISDIEVRLTVNRFEERLFQIDSNATRLGLQQLQKEYPVFLPLFINHVLGLGPLTDSNQLAYEGTKRFIHLNQPVFQTSRKLYKNFNPVKKELETAFRYVNYYFPDYKIPSLITTIGPMDALAPMSNNEPSPNYLGEDFLAIGLQFYLGNDYAVYNDPGFITNVVPTYRSRRFSKEFIATDVMKLVIDDMFPDSSSRLPLLEQFIEKGKRLYLLQHLLPEHADTLLIGYTQKQLEWCHSNERSIYNFFAQQNLLYERDPSLTQPFLTDGPFTQGMPEASPGNIGAYLGWQIVKAYLKKNETITLPQFMQTTAKEIMNRSAYKPR